MAEEMNPGMNIGRKPLDGIRVVDVTNNANGPFCTQILGLLGAEVIKVEPPGGQSERTALSAKPDLLGIRFIMLNHSKKGITLNLKTELGLEMVKELVKKSDVFMENMRPGTIERLGLGYEDLKKINPGIVYASSKGFGRTGSYSSLPAADATVQAMGGAMSVNGFPGNPPCKVGPAIGDWATSIYTALGIVAALRLRDLTGIGQMVESCMQESVIALTLDHQQIYLEYGVVPGRGGNMPYSPNPDLPRPKAVYETKDGYVYIAISHNAMWEAALKVIGREDLVGAPQYNDMAKRFEHSVEIDGIIEEWTRGRTREDVMQTMGRAGVMVGMVRDLKEVMEDPDLNAKKFFNVLDHPGRGEVKVFGLPLRFSGSSTDPELPCPSPGQHNQDIYGSLLGYGTEELADLRKAGVI